MRVTVTSQEPQVSRMAPAPSRCEIFFPVGSDETTCKALHRILKEPTKQGLGLVRQSTCLVLSRTPMTAPLKRALNRSPLSFSKGL